MEISALALLLKERGVDRDTALNISLRVRRDPSEMVDWLNANPDASPEEICRQARRINADTIQKEFAL